MASGFEEEVSKLLESLIGSKAVLNITTGLYKGNYVSSFEEFNDGLLGMSHPTIKGQLLPYMRGMELTIKIETINGLYNATASVTRSAFNIAIPLLWLKLISPMEKVQRRMFVRVPCNIKGKAFFLNYMDELIPEETNLPPKEWFPINISDISLRWGGIYIKDNLLFYCLEGGRYLFSMEINGVSFFVVGKIVKILKKKDVSTEIGFAYESLPASIEKTMINYIIQQELMTRG